MNWETCWREGYALFYNARLTGFSWRLIPFARVMSTQCDHVSSTVLIPRNCLDPVLCVFTLQEPNNQVMHTPRIWMKYWLLKGARRTIERGMYLSVLWLLVLPNNVLQRDSAHAWDHGQIICKWLLPFWPFPFVPKFLRVCYFSVCNNKYEIRLPDLRKT